MAPADAVGAEQLGFEVVVGDQVPDPGLVDQAVGVQGVAAHAAVLAMAIAQAQAPVRKDGLLQCREVSGWAHRWLAPAGRVDQDAPAGQVGVGAVGGGQGGHELAQRRADGLAQAQLGVRAARQQHEQGAGLFGGQAGDVGAVARQQRDPAVRATHGVDRHPGRGQRLDVAHDGAHRHLQTLGQLAGRQPPAGLQQQQDRQQPVGSHGFKNPTDT